MTKKQTIAIALLFDALKTYFDTEEKERKPQDRTPIHTLKSKMFAALCKTLDIDCETAYLLSAFAIALTKGMVENKDDITQICGGDYKGGNLITALEALRISIK